MEKGFGTVFWDYSDKPLNLEGRVCLQYSAAWGLVALLPAYAAGSFLPGAANAFGHQELGETVLSVLMVLVLLSWTVTLAAFARLGKRVASLKTQASGGTTAISDTAWDRLVDRLAPDLVMINTFPQTSVTTDLMELTGRRQIRIRLPGVRALSHGREHGANETRRTAWS